MKFCRPVDIHTIPLDITTGFSSKHPAIDYNNELGCPIYAVQSGIVRSIVKTIQTSWIARNRPLTTADYGNYIILDHTEGFSSLYAHLQYGSIHIKVGQTISQGQQIASMGSTGNSTGSHLHFELRKRNIKVNLADYLDENFNNYHTIQEQEALMPELMQIEKKDYERLRFASELGDVLVAQFGHTGNIADMNIEKVKDLYSVGIETEKNIAKDDKEREILEKIKTEIPLLGQYNQIGDALLAIKRLLQQANDVEHQISTENAFVPVAPIGYLVDTISITYKKA